MTARYKIIFSQVGTKSFTKLPKIVRTQILKKLIYLELLSNPIQKAKKLEDMDSLNRQRWTRTHYL